MRPGRKNGIKPDGWKIELELGNKQDLLEIGRQRGNWGVRSWQSQYKKVAGLSKNIDSKSPHNTREIIASNDQA